MAAPVIQKAYIQDINRPIEVRHGGGLMFTGDANADRISVALYDCQTPFALSGSVTGTCIRNDGQTVVLTGGILGGNTAYVVLAQSCFVVPGPLAVTIRVSAGGVSTTVLKAMYTIDQTTTEEIVDPGHVVPDISDIVAEYARMQAASDAAEAAAASANEAAQFATDDEWTNGDTLQTGRVYQTLHMANFEEETAGQYLRVISGNVAQAERVNQSGWSVYRYDLPHRMLIRLEAIDKNTPTVQGVLPMAAVLTSGSTETLYSLDSDRTGTYILADALLVNYSTTLNASAIKSVSITAVANRQFEDVIVCLDHAADFDKIVVFGDSIFANYINSTTVGNGVMAQFASLMGLPVVNNAVGGATLSTIQTSPKSVVQQVQDYVGSATPGGTPLYMIDGGTNDQYNGGAGLSNLGQYTDGVNGITNTIYGATYRIINDLLGFGAQPWQIVITTPIPKGIRGNAAYVATMDAQLTAIAGAMAEIAMVQQCNVINGYGAPFDNLITDTAKAVIMPDDTHPSVYGAKLYAERIFRLLGVANQQEVTSLKSAINEIVEKEFALVNIEDIPGVTKLTGTSFAISDDAPGWILGQSLSGYDSYYFYTNENNAVYFESTSQTQPSYIALTVGYEPSKEWTSYQTHPTSMQCDSALRKRNSDSNLPTQNAPLDVGNAIVCITVPANTSISFYINNAVAIRDGVRLPLVQTSGQDTTKAMSQKAIADAIDARYGEIVDERERPELISKNAAVATHNGYYIYSDGELVESTNYNTYIFRFDADTAVYTTDAIATGESPYLSLAVYNGDTIDSAHLVSWARNYNSSTVMPTQNNKLNVLASQSLAVTVAAQAASTFTYYSEPIKYLNPDIIVEAQGGKTGQIKYHENGVYIACPVNAGYVVYDFNKYTNASTNADGWGIDKAYLYDNNLAPVTNITVSGEWECAVHLVNRPDFSGLRAHGSEVYNGLMFVIDGKYYTESDIDQITEWTPFESVIIYETSKLYDPSDEVTEIADHWKRYIWQGAKLTIKQKLKWLIADTATNCYLAMFPASKAVTNYFVDNSNFVFKDLTNVTPSYNVAHCKSISLFSAGGQTAEVCATFGIGEYNAGGTDYDGFLLTDNGGGLYNKCYYLIGTNKAIAVDEIWKSESFYEWQI